MGFRYGAPNAVSKVPVVIRLDFDWASSLRSAANSAERFTLDVKMTLMFGRFARTHRASPEPIHRAGHLNIGEGFPYLSTALEHGHRLIKPRAMADCPGTRTLTQPADLDRRA